MRFIRRLTWLAVVVLAVLLAAEVATRLRLRRIRRATRFDTGFGVYDGQLGWTLKPGWQAAHRHHDFNVAYSTTPEGYRTSVPSGTGTLVVVTGDSFTFGYGVNDADTFVSRMNLAAGDRYRFLNAGVPGYSTDQQYLQIRDRLLPLRPAVVLLVLYLGNDLFDNMTPYPHQADRAKPFFEVARDGDLRLCNVPVPLAPKPPGVHVWNLRRLALGAHAGPLPAWARLAGRFELAGVLGASPPLPPDLERLLTVNLQHPVDLTLSLLRAAGNACREQGAGFAVALLPGASLVTSPRSLAARVQMHFRASVLNALTDEKVIDLAEPLLQQARDSRQRLYHPNDGHLTPAGHLVVARTCLARAMRDEGAGPE